MATGYQKNRRDVLAHWLCVAHCISAARDYEGAMHDPRVHKAIQEDREVRRLRARAWLLFRRFHRLRLPWEAWPEHGGGRGGMKLARTRAQQCRRAAQAWR
jgi:hypothetical protein